MIWLIALTACLQPLETKRFVGELDHDWDGDGFTEDGGDCDDDDAAVGPDADELCNGADDDCDDQIDNDAVDSTTWWNDGDGDGYGDPALPVAGCNQPDGAVAVPDALKPYMGGVERIEKA